jgi:hypothetical protein
LITFPLILLIWKISLFRFWNKRTFGLLKFTLSGLYCSLVCSCTDTQMIVLALKFCLWCSRCGIRKSESIPTISWIKSQTCHQWFFICLVILENWLPSFLQTDWLITCFTCYTLFKIFRRFEEKQFYLLHLTLLMNYTSAVVGRNIEIKTKPFTPPNKGMTVV